MKIAPPLLAASLLGLLAPLASAQAPATQPAAGDKLGPTALATLDGNYARVVSTDTLLGELK